MKSAASYARLSLTNDAKQATIEYQERKNAEFAKELGYSIVPDAYYHEDEGHRSGRHIEQRKAMQRLMADLGKYRAVFFNDFTRYSRNVEFAFEFLRAAQKVGAKLYDTETREEITDDNLASFLKFGIKSLFAEYESRAASERVRRAYSKYKSNGWVHERNAQFGLRIVGSGAARHYERDPRYFKTAVMVLELCAQGYSQREIAETMNKRGKHAKGHDGQPVKFEAHTVLAMVRKLAPYRGFVDDAILDAIERRREERRGKRGAVHPRKNAPLILSGLLVCGACGSRMVTHYNYDPAMSVRKYYPNYLHSKRLCEDNHAISASKAHEQVFRLLERWARLVNEETDFLDEVQRARAERENVRDFAAERKALQDKLDAAKRRMFDDPELADEYRELKREIESQLAELAAAETHAAPASLSAEQIRAIVESAHGWRQMAQEHPVRFGAMLRDMFIRVESRKGEPLRFVPRDEIAAYFAGII